MIETDEQRRWWFATHPEFSSSRTGEKRRRHDDDDEDEDSGRPAPERVDEMVNERLEYETDPVRRTLLELTKYYFGTEFQSKTPAEREAILREDEDWPEDTEEPANASGNDWWSQQPAEAQAPHKFTDSQYKKMLDLMEPTERERFERAIELDKKGVEADPHTFLDIVPYRRMITSPIEVLKRLIRSTAEGAVVRAAKRGGARWKVGDDVLAPTSKGVEPSWSAQARRHWKNQAANKESTDKFGEENVGRMKRDGSPPRRKNPDTGEPESKELHHTPTPRRHGGKEFIEVWPEEHAAIDPYRRLKKR